MCGYTIIYSLQMPQGHDILCLVFAQGEVTEVDYTCHGELLAYRSQLRIYQSESNEPDSTVVVDVEPSEPVVDVAESTDGSESGEASELDVINEVMHAEPAAVIWTHDAAVTSRALWGSSIEFSAQHDGGGARASSHTTPALSAAASRPITCLIFSRPSPALDAALLVQQAQSVLPQRTMQVQKAQVLPRRAMHPHQNQAEWFCQMPEALEAVIAHRHRNDQRFCQARQRSSLEIVTPAHILHFSKSVKMNKRSSGSATKLS